MMIVKGRAMIFLLIGAHGHEVEKVSQDADFEAMNCPCSAFLLRFDFPFLA
jgi:hypothetical protein